MMFCFGILLTDLKSSAINLSKRSFASRRLINKRKKEKDYAEDSPLDDIQDADYVDLSNLEQSSKEMYRNVELIREREKYLIVKQKYFKSNAPNFLSWNEKMKIRNLHSNDAEEWSIDKLSESFPALPYAISKIVASKWMKNSQNKITNHDEVVEQNWKEFREGKLNLPDDLTEHLRNFTSRERNTLHLLESDIINVTPPQLEPPPNSFEAIIASYKNNKTNQIKYVIEEPKKLESALNNAKTITGKKRDASNILMKNMDLSNAKPELLKKKREPLFTVPGLD